MGEKVLPRDRLLTALSLVIGILMWAAILAAIAHAGSKAMAATAGGFIVAVLLGSLAYVFARSAAIAHLRGNATEVTEHQLPDLHRQLQVCCEALQVPSTPRMYLQNGNGIMNAFATWFLGQKYVILLSGLVDAMEASPNGVRFYIGHELGHVLRHDQPPVALLRWPALRLPLLGAAFSRARESTCDRHGLACSQSPELAAQSLAALSAGAKSWASASLEGYRRQVAAGRGFWISFHELISSYPWTGKRIVRVLDPKPALPRRNPLAYLLAAFVPYAGRMGAGLGILIYIYVIGILAAVAIPAYQNYTVRAVLANAATESQQARQQLTRYYLSEKAIPQTLNEAGIAAHLANGVQLFLDPAHMVLTVHTARGDLIFTPRRLGDGRIMWACSGGQGVNRQQLPPSCE